MSRSVDTRSPEAVHATKGNIVPDTYHVQPGISRDEPEFSRKYVARDASIGASALVTDDTTGETLDTGPLAAGTYEVFLKARHPSTAAANRQLLVQHRNAANAATVRTLATHNADGPTGGTAVYGPVTVTVAAGERVRVVSGSDATNANVVAELRVTRVV